MFTSGSYLKGDNGKSCAGYAIAIHLGIEAAHLPVATSALQPELHPFTWACTLAKSKIANIGINRYLLIALPRWR